jgi:hypothetical protein
MSARKTSPDRGSPNPQRVEKRTEDGKFLRVTAVDTLRRRIAAVRCVLSMFCAGLGSIVGAAKELPPPANAKVDFVRDIKPLFERSCLQCHGPNKPKSGFRLDNRASAMKGGDNGVAIVPGDSANSVLVQVVAGLHDTIEKMPPEGKAEPLTTPEVSLLRAWIDQGAQWPDASAVPTGPQTTAAVAPMFRWIDVSGDNHKFREHFWMKEGVHAGVESFSMEERVSPDSALRVDGRFFLADEDFRIALRYDRTDFGFIHVGLDQYRKYYDDSGGFYPFSQPLFSLDRDLELRIGKLWADFGLTLPDAPKVTLGYEYQYREGAKSTLQWGSVRRTSLPVLPETSIERKIYPASKEIDEGVHILKLDASHELDGVFLEDNLRFEFFDLKTQRQNALSVTEGQMRPSLSEVIDEAHDELNVVNALRAEKEIREWWLMSAGYLYSRAEADAAFRQNTVHASGLPVAGDYWRSQSIILSQNSILLNANTRVGPWQHTTFSAGVQSEWMRQDGLGRVNLETGNPALPLTPAPATLDANLQRQSMQESASLRYTGLPFTSLFAEARLEQETYNTFEQEIGGHHEFARETDAHGDTVDWRAGFYSSPLNRVSFGGHYRQRNKETDYADNLDDTASYPAFFRERTIETEEIEAKITVRPLTWLKTTFTYQLVDTEFNSDTDTLTNGIPTRLRAGTFDAHVYGANLVLTPFTRWYFSGTFNYYDSRAASAENQSSVVPYEGDLYSIMASATYMLSTNVDLTASYAFSRADYAQDNLAAGLPLGIKYDWHAIQAGIVRRFRRATANLQYAYYDYTEPSAGGFNDYTAHAVFATINLHWP